MFVKERGNQSINIHWK